MILLLRESLGGGVCRSPYFNTHRNGKTSGWILFGLLFGCWGGLAGQSVGDDSSKQASATVIRKVVLKSCRSST